MSGTIDLLKFRADQFPVFLPFWMGHLDKNCVFKQNPNCKSVQLDFKYGHGSHLEKQVIASSVVRLIITLKSYQWR